MKVIILQHISIEDPGYIKDLMIKDGAELTTIELDEGQKIPSDLSKFDAMFCMGGPMDTWMEKDYPWLIEEKKAINEFVVFLKKPYLGFCLGCQLLGEVTGGKVVKSKNPEIGMLDINFSENKNNDLLFSKFPEKIKSLQWHSYEVCDLPKNTELLASSPLCGVQAFSFGNAFGLQFHVEQTNETVPQWACVPEYKSALEKTLGSNALEKFKKEVEVNLKIFNSSARTIYDNFKKII